MPNLMVSKYPFNTKVVYTDPSGDKWGGRVSRCDRVYPQDYFVYDVLASLKFNKE